MSEQPCARLRLFLVTIVMSITIGATIQITRKSRNLVIYDTTIRPRYCRRRWRGWNRKLRTQTPSCQRRNSSGTARRNAGHLPNQFQTWLRSSHLQNTILASVLPPPRLWKAALLLNFMIISNWETARLCNEIREGIWHRLRKLEAGPTQHRAQRRFCCWCGGSKGSDRPTFRGGCRVPLRCFGWQILEHFALFHPFTIAQDRFCKSESIEEGFSVTD